MFERPMTDRAKKVMALANHEALWFNHEYIDTAHILLGLVKEGSGVGANVLGNLGVDLRRVRLEVEKLVKSGPDRVIMGLLPRSPGANYVITCAIEEARNLNHNYVGTEHLLLGLLRDHDSVAANVLAHLLGKNVEEALQTVRGKVSALLEQQKDSSSEPELRSGCSVDQSETDDRQWLKNEMRRIIEDLDISATITPSCKVKIISPALRDDLPTMEAIIRALPTRAPGSCLKTDDDLDQLLKEVLMEEFINRTAQALTRADQAE